MACYWQNVPGVGMVHFNVAKNRRRKCAHCDCPDAKALCDWPMIKLARFKIDHLVPGDVLRSSTCRWRAQIDTLHVVPAQGELQIRATIIESGLHTAFAIWPTNLHLFRVERQGTCDKPCCYRCRRHPAPNVDYCMDHWHLQAGENLRLATGDRARVPERRAREQRSLFDA